MARNSFIEHGLPHSTVSITAVKINRINKLKNIFLKVFLIPIFFESLSIKIKDKNNKGIVIKPLADIEKIKLKNPIGTKIFINDSIF